MTRSSAADLLIDGQIALELERSDRNTLQNVRKNLTKGFKVLLVAVTSALKRRICHLLEQNDLHVSVNVAELKEFREPDVIHPLLSFPKFSSPRSVPKSKRGHRYEKTGETKRGTSVHMGS